MLFYKTKKNINKLNNLAFPYGESGSKSREMSTAAEAKCREATREVKCKDNRLIGQLIVIVVAKYETGCR